MTKVEFYAASRPAQLLHIWPEAAHVPRVGEVVNTPSDYRRAWQVLHVQWGSDGTEAEVFVIESEVPYRF